MADTTSVGTLTVGDAFTIHRVTNSNSPLVSVPANVKRWFGQCADPFK